MNYLFNKKKSIVRFYLLRRVLYLGLLILAAANSRAANAGGAVDVVTEFQSQLLATMKKSGSLGYSGRFGQLNEPIKKSHALDYIAKIIMGPNWKTLSKEQKATFIGIFTKLTIANYAFNFNDYSGESFKILSDKAKGKSKHVVRAVLTSPSIDGVSFDYLLKLRNKDWVIVNIIADGVSDLALKRAEYDSIIKKDGFDALLKKIQEKIDKYAKS